MTGKEVSPQQVAVITAVEKLGLGSARQVGREAAGVSDSAVRHILLALFNLGVLERHEHFKGFSYRLSQSAASNPYYARLVQHRVSS